MIPDNVVLFLPEPGDGQLGATLWGTTAESLEPEFGLSGISPELLIRLPPFSNVSDAGLGEDGQPCYSA